MIRKALILLCLTSTLLVRPSISDAAGKNRWVGTISITGTQENELLGENRCVHQRTFHMDVRLAEGKRTSGTDREGNAWETVELVDEGSSFTTIQKARCKNTREDLCNCPEKYKHNCAGYILSAGMDGSGSGSFRLQGRIRYSSDESLYPNGSYVLGGSSSHTTIDSGVLSVSAQRCYDTKEMEFPLSPVPYFVIGGNAGAPITSPQNDDQFRSLASGSDSGHYSYTIDHGNMGFSSVNVQWHIFRKEAIECRISEVDRQWRPHHLQLHDGARPVNITAGLIEPAESTGRFRFTLFEVSRELGRAMNQGDKSDLDMSFRVGTTDSVTPGFGEPAETGDGYVVETVEAAREATVEVAAWDFGAWGRLKAEVEVNGKWATCTSPETGRIYVDLPRDDNRNHIADSWEEAYGISGQEASADGDGTPAGLNPGDGFSNYEEYRGFFVRGGGKGESGSSDFGKWISTDPTRKDIFIHDGIGLGVGPFTGTGLQVHFIDEAHYNGHDSRLVNFNAGHAAARPVNGQHGLYLHSCELGEGVVGEVFPWIGSPNYVREVCVDTNQVFGTDRLLGVIAHELGHAVNLTHPGESYTTAICGGDTSDRVRPWGGVTSGDAANIMRYDDGEFYVGPDGNCYGYPDYDSRGTSYATSTDGTGINAGEERNDHQGRLLPMSGDASWDSTCLEHMSLTSDGPNLSGGTTRNDIEALEGGRP